MMRLRAEGWILLGAVGVATGLALVSNARVPGPPRQMALPTASELVEMERYLDPVDAAVGTQVGIPPRVEIDGSPFGRVMVETAVDRPTGPVGEPAPRWVLSAVMIAGDRRVAIVNDELARPGERLSDGARVAEVGQNYIVLITPTGERRRLELQR